MNHQFLVEFTQVMETLIAEYAIEKRLFIPYDSIPETSNKFFLIRRR